MHPTIFLTYKEKRLLVQIAKVDLLPASIVRKDEITRLIDYKLVNTSMDIGRNTTLVISENATCGSLPSVKGYRLSKLGKDYLVYSKADLYEFLKRSILTPIFVAIVVSLLVNLLLHLLQWI